ncbi:hypothetical protein [Sphingomonas solaris]|uniref:Uncharacterized protein n=1 Tax=Alterirhizorhabdus solaris TaxID=2529389 RepID=A0A558R378_9SPHN|nr:hypothetical protein [Sphingomonas solaris]TVV73845.1 hypothetical protein FOY91_11260 [Sphingomonas solaris]
MKLSGLAVAAGLLLASFGTATVAQAQAPTVAGWHEARYERGPDHRRLERHDRHDRRWNRDRRGWRNGRAYGRGHAYRQPHCRSEWRHGRRVRVCR